MKLNDIHFHDTVIYRVTEDTDKDTFTFEVDYPVDWQNDVYERKLITFSDVLYYQVHEGPFVGPPTLLKWSIVGTEHGREVVRFETNAGYRQLAFSSVSISNAT